MNETSVIKYQLNFPSSHDESGFGKEENTKCKVVMSQLLGIYVAEWTTYYYQWSTYINDCETIF